MIEAYLEVRGIAAKNYGASFRQPHKQRLMAGGMSGGGKQQQAPVPKDIVIAVDQLYRMRLFKADSVLSAPSPFVFNSLRQHQRVGEHLDVPCVIRVTM